MNEDKSEVTFVSQTDENKLKFDISDFGYGKKWGKGKRGKN
jgi:hypothetical protein